MTSPTSNSEPARSLPSRANLDVLRREAKRRLIELRHSDISAQLSDAQFEIAREYGFSSWRTLKGEIDQRGVVSTDYCLGSWIGRRLDGLRLALHVSVDQGEIVVLMDSPDYHSYGFPVTDINVTRPEISFSLPKVNATFRGYWVDYLECWDGTWRQDGLEYPIRFARGTYPTRPTFEDVDGTWEGYIGDTGPRLIYRVITDTHGTFALCDSPDRSGSGFPVETIERNGEAVSFSTATATLTGALHEDGKIVAAYNQAGKSWPITLRRRELGASPLSPRSVELPHGSLLKLVGDYGQERSATSIKFEDGELSAHFSNGIKIDLIPVSSSEFHFNSGDGKLLFDFGADGSVSRLMFNKGIRNISADRRI